MEKLIQQIDLVQINEHTYNRRAVACIVLTQAGKILLQKRTHHAPTFPDKLSTFGGSLEADETPMQALIRELKEELGAKVNEATVVNIGAITEKETRHQLLIYCYFWHDRAGTITGCYEGEARLYDDCAAALQKTDLMMDDARWLLEECQKRGLLK